LKSLLKIQLNFRYEKTKQGITHDVSAILEVECPEEILSFQPGGLYDDANNCQFCKAYRFPRETAGICCNRGKIDLPLPRDPPDKLKDLFGQSGFINKIRKYNNALALASIGLQEDVMTGFSPTVKIHSTVYHKIGSLLPEPGQVATFAQIYFYDSTDEEEAKTRLHHNGDLQFKIIFDLQCLLHQVNPFIQSIKSVLELPNVEEKKLVLSTKEKPSAAHNRTYNLPMANEIAILELSESTRGSDVILHLRNGCHQRISNLNRTYDPLHYVLLFPYGDEGYHIDILQKSSTKRVSTNQYYRHRLMVRPDNFNIITKGKRLTQQYMVDAYVKAEHQRLFWARSNQKTIKADKYKGLYDALHQDDLARAGKNIILPPSIYGGPRWYAEVFHDSMSIVRHYGKPDLLLTFTCNAKWPEIAASLHPNEKSEDRPDITTRVFHNRLQYLMDDLLKFDILGHVKAFTCMKEDQKRGLPHVHMLLFLADEDKPREPHQVDKFICAELPDININPILVGIITGLMIHGPCGKDNPFGPCMAMDKGEKKCTKKYPKPYVEKTTISAQSQAMYRRRSPEQGGKTMTLHIKATGMDVLVDNKWVVPYNPILCLKYNAHINLEIVNSVKSIKYVTKYICKGSDRIMVKLPNGEESTHAVDEIGSYENARYVSASSAAWRLMEFPLMLKYPPVDKLPLHLKDEQQVLFEPETVLEAVERGPPVTKLVAFFQLNQETDEAKDILYPDIYRHYRWDKKQWVKRKNNTRRSEEGSAAAGSSEMIGRIPVINLNPHQTELYFLRSLLYHKAGPKSFEDLRTVDGVLHETNQAACKTMGLYDDDDELDQAMEEAALIKFGKALRNVFIQLLVFCRPAVPFDFYQSHKDKLAEDFMRRDHTDAPTEGHVNEVLLYLEEGLIRANTSMEAFKLPLPDMSLIPNHVPRVIREETDYIQEELLETLETNIPLLNPAQQDAHDKVLESVVNGEGKLFALDAPGGTGKTFTLTTILASVRSQHKIAFAMATSGIAATLLPNGQTVHSKLKVPFDLDENSTCNIYGRSATATLVKECSLMVIDEVTMANKAVFATIDRSLKFIRENDRPFGGITMLFSGDWRQILPVVIKGGKIEIINASLKSSPLWKTVHIVYYFIYQLFIYNSRYFLQIIVLKLTENLRVKNAGADSDDMKSFSKLLLAIGEGKFPIVYGTTDTICMPPEFIFQGNTLKDFCQTIYPNLEENKDNFQWLCQRAIICPTNDGASKVNDLMSENFPGQSTVYLSHDSVKDVSQKHQYPDEFLNTVLTSGMAAHKIILKIGVPIMLLRNFDPKHGHCNGARYIVKHLKPRVIHAVLATGPHIGKDLLIPRINMIPNNKHLGFEMVRKQFPIRLCFGITSNKSQGQTLDQAGIYLDKQFFSHGQLYVAMSRVGNPKKITIFNPDRKQQLENVVYKEILS
jgi:hypothetical protein